MRRTVVAAIALSVLALLFGWETRQAMQATPGGQDNAATVPAGAWHPGVPAPDPQPPPDPTPVVSAVAARPLFRPDRQPFREQAAGVSAQNREAELSRYTLLGVLGFGDAPIGVVVGKGGNKGERWEVKKGDSFQGFMVEEVGMEGLRLTADGKEFLLPLYAGAPTAAPAPTTAPARAAAPARPSAATAIVPAPAQTIPPPPEGLRPSLRRR